MVRNVTKIIVGVVAIIGVSLLNVSVTAGEETKKISKSPAKAAAKPKSSKKIDIKKSPFVVQLDLKGIFESKKMSEIVLSVEEWKVWKVTQCVSLGQKVHKGDLLVAYETEKIDRLITQMEFDQGLKSQALAQGQMDLMLLTKALPLELSAAKRALKLAKENVELFERVVKPWAKKWSVFGVKRMKDRLSYEMEELRQLEKMYAEDEMTEETEEIILTRQKNSVKMMQFYLSSSESQKEQSDQVNLPRAEASIKQALALQLLAEEKAVKVLPAAVAKKKLDLESMAFKIKLGNEKLARLKVDRSRTKLISPVDGVVYFGRCENGHWPQAAGLAAVLRKGGMAKPNQVLFTIIEADDLQIRVTVPEAQLHYIKKGVEGAAKPLGFPEVSAKAKVESIQKVSLKEGNFEAVFSVEDKAIKDVIVPGMQCALKVIPYKKKDALSIPKSAVTVDHFEGGKKFVWVVLPKGKSEKRWVETGLVSSGKVEILKGLKEGEQIYPSKPAKPTAKDKAKQKAPAAK